MTCKKHYNWNTDAPCPYCRIDELERMLRMKQEDWISACNEAQVFERLLSETQLELALSIKERIELGGKLSRYQGGVEVESRLLVDDNEVQLVSDVREWPIGHGFDIGQQVRVLVIPKEVE